jgi:hypothetical protein
MSPNTKKPRNRLEGKSNNDILQSSSSKVKPKVMKLASQSSNMKLAPIGLPRIKIYENTFH